MDTVNLIDSVRAALEELLPGAMTAVAHEVSGQFFAAPEALAHLAAAKQSRRDEFTTGRHCLRQALAELGTFEATLLPDEDGVPQLPPGFLGSISHSRGLCLAVAAASARYAYLGVDVEKTSRLSDLAMKRVVHPDEANWVCDDQVKGSLLFSAKEAFYKAQFVQWRCTGNFHDLALRILESSQRAEVRWISKHFPVELCKPPKPFEFHYRFVEDYVITVCFALK